MTCDELEGLLPAFADGEFDGPERAEVDAHLAACPGCREVVADLVSFRSFVHTRCASDHVPAPDALRRRIHRELGREHLRDQARRFTAISAVAASFVVVASVGYVVGRPAEPEATLILEDLVDKSQRQVPMDARGPDADRWFQGKLPFAVEVPRFSGVSLVGGRLGNVREHDAAHVVYEHGPARRFSVMAYAADRAPAVEQGRVIEVKGRRAHLHQLRGHNVVIWSREGVVYNLVTDSDEADVVELLRQLEDR